MKPEYTKRTVDQLIGDIYDNEWYCVQCGSESEMTELEKEIIIEALIRLLGDYWKTK